jgi:uncharacterized protein (DUF1810 family)
MADLLDLERFIEAQNPVYAGVVAELSRGRKETHWMWFVFPQLRGLGYSSMASYYGIGSRSEAEAYLAHPVLGARLVECTGLVNAVAGASVEEIFGYPDDLKFRSSMTLFAAVAGAPGCFLAALGRYFGGEPDGATLKILQG